MEKKTAEPQNIVQKETGKEQLKRLKEPGENREMALKPREGKRFSISGKKSHGMSESCSFMIYITIFQILRNPAIKAFLIVCLG